MISLQTIFTQAVQHLCRQRQGAVDTDSGSCRYRHPDDGTRCAVGYLISDAVYEQFDVESKSASCPAVKQAVFATVGEMERGAFDLLGELQYDHDDTIGNINRVLNYNSGGEDDPIYEWARRTLRTAKAFNLIVPRQVHDILNEEV